MYLDDLWGNRMAYLEEQCQSTCAIIAESAIDNTHWKAFGYRRRPKRGKLFRRFVPAETLRQETFLLQEFWAASFARISFWALMQKHFQYRVEFIARLMELCIDGVEESLWPTLRFESAHNAVSYLKRACLMYCSHDISEHDQVFIERCTALLKQEIPPAWHYGATWFFSHPDSLITTIIPALDTSGITENTESNLLIHNRSYRQLVNKLFTSFK
jgi:hypothetical protein